MDNSEKSDVQRKFPVKTVVWIGRASIVVGIIALFAIIIPGLHIK